MSRKPTFVKKINVVQALNDLAGTSYFHRRQLVADGYLEAVKKPEAKKVPGSRGRMPLEYVVTKRGQNLIRLSASWGKVTPKTEAPVETAPDAATV